MYRDLAPGDVGADVRQLEANLAKLGYRGFTVDGAYSASTASAVRAWQRRIGAIQTGTLALGDVVFVANGGWVDALGVGVGDFVTPGMPVLEMSGRDQVAILRADLEDRDRFDIDAEVTVVLPGGEEVRGRISAMRVVRSAPGAPGETAGAMDPEPMLEVEVAIGGAPDELVGSPVDVVVAVDERADVLLVPVNALLALAEGGYGLEVVRADGTTEIVRVDTGLFADGKVEVRGAGITKGTVVGVAGR
jgi:hypothetical protein